MYKVLIVDDEEIIRRGLRVIIDWESLGVDEIFTAASGEQASEILSRESVDFMLTDLCMVNMSGLELIERVNQMKTDMRIVVLTGYDSFEYARQCCRLEVHDFLLKPVDGPDLEQAVKKQLDLLRAAREEKERQQFEYRMEGITEQYWQEKLCRDLVKGRAKEEELNRLCRERRCSPCQEVQAIVVLPVIEKEKSWKDHYEYQYLTAKNLCISLYDACGQGLTFEDELGRIVICMFAGKQYDEVEERVRDLKEILSEETGRQVNLLIGCRAEGLKYLQTSYEDAISIIPRVKEKGAAVYNTPKSELRLKIFRETVAELQKIMEEHLNELPVLLKTYDTYIRCTKSYNLSESMMRRTLYQLISSLYYEYRIARGEKETDYVNRVIESLEQCSEEEMAEAGRECIQYLFGRGSRKTHEVIRLAKEYIHENLSQELSLASMAEQSFVSPVYFSRLFKQEMGEGFNEYVVKQRMEQAKTLLVSTGMRSGETAYKVGYKDVNYFSAAFKKNVGMSPREYREKMKKGKGIKD